MTAAKRNAPTARRKWILPAALALVVVLGVVAVIASRGGSGDGGEDADALETVETAPVRVNGPPLPDFGDGADAARGTAAPVVRGEGLDASAVTIGGAGEPQLIFFVAHWCPHCQTEVPVIADWIDDQGRPEGVELKGVSTGVNPEAPNYPPSRWLDREDWPIETLVDSEDSKAAQAYGLTGYPFFVALDADGKVVARASGELTVAQIESLVAAARG